MSSPVSPAATPIDAERFGAVPLSAAVDGTPLSGALLVPGQLVQRVRAVLEETGWQRGTLAVTGYTPVGEGEGGNHPRAVHLSRRGAYAFGMAVSGKLSELSKNELRTLGALRALGGVGPLDDDDHAVLRWMPGLHVLSAACRGAPVDAALRGWRAIAEAQPYARFTFCELFAGIGGFRLGLEALGGRCVFASELNRTAVESYMENFAAADGAARVLGDVSTIDAEDVPEFDLLTAGFPCQPYCRLNWRTPGGLAADDGQFVHDIIRLLRARLPALVLLENVPLLQHSRGGADFYQIVEALRAAGYFVDWRTIDARVCVPQQRRRLYIVCVRRDITLVRGSAIELSRDDGRTSCSNSQAHGVDHQVNSSVKRANQTECQDDVDLSQDADADSLPLSGKAIPCKADSFMEWPPSLFCFPEMLSRGETADPCRRLSAILEPVGPGTDKYALSAETWAAVAAKEGSKLEERRLAQLGGYARTLASSYRSGLLCYSEFVPRGDGETPRLYTPRECCRIMGFPESFRIVVDDAAFYKQIGNAVCPQVVGDICKTMLSVVGR